MEKVKLRNICKVQSGYAFKNKEFQKNDIPIIRFGNIQNDEVNELIKSQFVYIIHLLKFNISGGVLWNM